MINDVISVSTHALSKEELEKIIQTIDNYYKEIGKLKEPKLEIKVNDIIRDKIQLSKSEKRFFIKPVGVSNEPFSIHRTLSSGVEKLHFSKRRPAAVRVGDVMICYAVGTAKLLGYFEVLEEPVFLKDKDTRWPWEVAARNLCSDYSDNWNVYNNTISSIQTSFSADVPITYVGGNTLGALNFGADKVQLTVEFAHHVINIIEESKLKEEKKYHDKHN